MENPAATWSFDHGTLTVHHLGKTVSLGCYATHEFAAKAAAVYFAKHQARKEPSALQSANAAPGMLSKKSVADSELFKAADTAAIEATSINRRVHQPLVWV